MSKSHPFCPHDMTESHSGCITTPLRIQKRTGNVSEDARLQAGRRSARQIQYCFVRLLSFQNFLEKCLKCSFSSCLVEQNFFY